MKREKTVSLPRSQSARPLAAQLNGFPPFLPSTPKDNRRPKHKDAFSKAKELYCRQSQLPPYRRTRPSSPCRFSLNSNSAPPVTARSTLSILSSEHKKLSSKIQRLNVEIQMIREKRVGLDGEYEKFVEKQGKKLQFTEEQLSKLSTRTLTLKQKLSEQRKSRDQLRAALSAAEAEQFRLQAAKSALRERHLQSFQSDLDKLQCRSLEALFRLIWKGFVTDPDLRQQYSKKELTAVVDGKRKEDLEDWLGEFGLNRREVKRISAEFTTNGRVKSREFVRQMKKLRPFPLQKHIVREIHDFRLHFSLRNLSKADLQSQFYAKPKRKIREADLISFLSSKELALSQSVASVVVQWLLRSGEESILPGDIFAEIPAWDCAETIAASIRLHCMSTDMQISDLSRLFQSLPDRGTLGNRLGLTEEQTEVAEELVKAIGFNKAFPLPWETQGESEASGLIIELSPHVSQDDLFEICEKSQKTPDSGVDLGDFIAKFENKTKLTLSEAQRLAVETDAFRATHKLNQLDFQRFCELIREGHLRGEKEDPAKVLLTESSLETDRRDNS